MWSRRPGPERAGPGRGGRRGCGGLARDRQRLDHARQLTELLGDLVAPTGEHRDLAPGVLEQGAGLGPEGVGVAPALGHMGGGLLACPSYLVLRRPLTPDDLLGDPLAEDPGAGLGLVEPSRRPLSTRAACWSASARLRSAAVSAADCTCVGLVLRSGEDLLGDLTELDRLLVGLLHGVAEAVGQPGDHVLQPTADRPDVHGGGGVPRGADPLGLELRGGEQRVHRLLGPGGLLGGSGQRLLGLGLRLLEDPLGLLLGIGVDPLGLLAKVGHRTGRDLAGLACLRARLVEDRRRLVLGPTADLGAGLLGLGETAQGELSGGGVLLLCAFHRLGDHRLGLVPRLLPGAGWPPVRPPRPFARRRYDGPRRPPRSR